MDRRDADTEVAAMEDGRGRRWELFIVGPLLFAGLVLLALLVTGNLAQLLGPLDRDDWEYYGENPRILIYHTHGHEAYLPAMGSAAQAPATSAFARNPGQGVLQVGEMMARYLHDVHGFDVLHITGFYDEQMDGGGMVRPGSYRRSLMGVGPALFYHSAIDVVIDVHRDAPRRAETTALIDGESTARILLVVGRQPQAAPAERSDNAALAERLVSVMESEHPGLHRGEPFLLDFRANQHVRPASILVEVGGVDNTMEEAQRGAERFADALARVIAENDLPPY